MKINLKNILSLSTPVILLILSFTLFFKLDMLSPVQSILLRYCSYGVFLIAMAVGCWFNRTKVFFLSAVFLIVQYALVDMPANGVDKDFCSTAVFICAGLFLPINLFLFSILKERGILTLWGILRIGFILAQVLFTVWLIGSNNQDLLNSLNTFANPLKFVSATFFPQVPLLLFVMVFIFLILKFNKGKSPMDIAFLGTIPMLLAALHYKSQDMAVFAFSLPAGLMMMIAVIQDSYSMAFLDELTGLPSRRALKHALLKLSGRYTIAMLDVDFFKKFNDTHGHDVGDQVLKMVAACMMEVTGGGKPFRYGGEEFTILFAGKGTNEAIPHLDGLRENISKRGFTPRGKDRPGKKPKTPKAKISTAKQLFVTVSIGVSERNDKYKTTDEVMKAADNALYRAKKKGRNCVSK